MADTVSSIVTFSGNKKYQVVLQGLSDGTGETNVVKVDKSTLTGLDGTEPTSLVVEDITWDVQGWNAVKLTWDHTSDVTIALLSGNGFDSWKNTGGLVDSGSGGNGDILLSTIGTATANYTYNITLTLRLKD